MRTEAILATAISAVVGALWFVPAMIWGAEASRYTSTAMGETMTIEEDSDALAVILEGPAPVAWFRNKADVRNHFRMDDLTTERVVSFEQELKFDDILYPGEERPDTLYRTAYANARAPGYYAPLCAELLEVLASSCKIYNSRGRYYDGENYDDRTDISAAMAYVPSYPMGDPSTVSNGAMRDGGVSITQEETAMDADSRRIIFDRALAICEDLRARFGNCVIKRVSFDERTDHKEEKSLISNIRFGVYVDKSSLHRNALNGIVETINEELASQTG